MIRAIAIGLLVAIVVFAVSGGHVFLPLLFLPLGLFSLGDHRRRRRWW
jgi:hypothetical protein